MRVLFEVKSSNEADSVPELLVDMDILPVKEDVVMRRGRPHRVKGVVWYPEGDEHNTDPYVLVKLEVLKKPGKPTVRSVPYA